MLTMLLELIQKERAGDIIDRALLRSITMVRLSMLVLLHKSNSSKAGRTTPLIPPLLSPASALKASCSFCRETGQRANLNTLLCDSANDSILAVSRGQLQGSANILDYS